MKYKMLISVAVISCLHLAIPANAGILGAGLGGALPGAIDGDLVDGRNGAAGAVIGGLIGAGEAASREKQKQQQSEAAQQRQAEWEASQNAEMEKIQQRQVADSPRKTAQQTLMVETQKSLVRLGYAPGDVGVAGPALTEAVIEYQRSKGLLETGELSQALLTHMLQNGG